MLIFLRIFLKVICVKLFKFLYFSNENIVVEIKWFFFEILVLD